MMMKVIRFYTGIMITVLLLMTGSMAWAAFGDDIEKPAPVFSQEGGDWVGRLIPRGKSVPIDIRFGVEGGILSQPAATDFTEADMPTNLNWKNYRSGYFLLDIVPAVPGGEVTLSLSSDYFTSATDIWGTSDRAARTWSTIGIKNQTGKGVPAIITAVIKDGSVLDEDGTANGRIQVIIGPRDSFWGYAIGTLVIRFFGVFMVLGILMIGMLLSGKVFQYLDAKAKPAQPVAPAASQAAPAPEEEAFEETEVEPVAFEELPGDVAAAIGVGLHLYTNGGRNLRLSDMAEKAAAIGLAMHLNEEK